MAFMIIDQSGKLYWSPFPSFNNKKEEEDSDKWVAILICHYWSFNFQFYFSQKLLGNPSISHDFTYSFDLFYG